MAADETDRKIINAVLENSRLSYREIAKKTGVSAVTVLNRMTKLEESGAIKSFSAVPDYSVLGYDFQVMVLINPERSQLTNVERSLTERPEVYSVNQITGEFQLMALARFQSRQEMDRFISSLSDDSRIQAFKPEFILKSTKEENTRL